MKPTKLELNDIILLCVEILAEGNEPDTGRYASMLSDEDLAILEQSLKAARELIRFPEPAIDEKRLKENKAAFLDAVDKAREDYEHSYGWLLTLRDLSDRFKYGNRRAVYALAATFLMTGSVVGAAANSVPGSVLYPVKTGYENIKVALTIDEESKANELFYQAEARLASAESLLKQGDTEGFASLLAEMTEKCLEAQDIAGGLEEPARTEFFKQMDSFLNKVDSRLRFLAKNSNSQVRKDITEALLQLALKPLEPEKGKAGITGTATKGAKPPAVKPVAGGTGQTATETAGSGYVFGKVDSLAENYDVFSPNSDGIKDFTVFTVRAEKGLNLSIKVFTVAESKELAGFKLLENEAGIYTVSWDGSLSGGGIIGDGIYNIVLYQVDRNTGLSTQVRVDTVKPVAPVAIFPSGGTEVEGASISLSWEEVEDASYYLVEIASDSAFSVSKKTVSDILMNFVSLPVGNLTPGSWFWRVRAVDACGNQGDFSAGQAFVIPAAEPAAETLP